MPYAPESASGLRASAPVFMPTGIALSAPAPAPAPEMAPVFTRRSSVSALHSAGPGGHAYQQKRRLPRGQSLNGRSGGFPAPLSSNSGNAISLIANAHVQPDLPNPNASFHSKMSPQEAYRLRQAKASRSFAAKKRGGPDIPSANPYPNSIPSAIPIVASTPVQPHDRPTPTITPAAATSFAQAPVGPRPAMSFDHQSPKPRLKKHHNGVSNHGFLTSKSNKHPKSPTSSSTGASPSHKENLVPAPLSPSLLLSISPAREPSSTSPFNCSTAEKNSTSNSPSMSVVSSPASAPETPEHLQPPMQAVRRDLAADEDAEKDVNVEVETTQPDEVEDVIIAKGPDAVDKDLFDDNAHNFVPVAASDPVVDAREPVMATPEAAVAVPGSVVSAPVSSAPVPAHVQAPGPAPGPSETAGTAPVHSYRALPESGKWCQDCAGLGLHIAALVTELRSDDKSAVDRGFEALERERRERERRERERDQKAAREKEKETKSSWKRTVSAAILGTGSSLGSSSSSSAVSSANENRLKAELSRCEEENKVLRATVTFLYARIDSSEVATT
jgi:hypothetical protein